MPRQLIVPTARAVDPAKASAIVKAALPEWKWLSIATVEKYFPREQREEFNVQVTIADAVLPSEEIALRTALEKI